jgi:hypothetical protein
MSGLRPGLFCDSDGVLIGFWDWEGMWKMGEGLKRLVDGRVVRMVVLWVCCCVGVLLCGLVVAGPVVAWELPEGRVYEMVSPPFKADYGVELNIGALGAAPDGDSFVFQSIGAFAGTRADFLQARYVARRTSGGWVTSSTNPPPVEVKPPGGLIEFSRLPGSPVDYSPDLCREVTLVSAFPGALPGGSQGTAALMLNGLCEGEISFTQAWPLTDTPATFPGCAVLCAYDGAAADLSHLFFQEFSGGLYQVAGVGGPDPREEAVGVVGEHDGPGGTVLRACPGPGGHGSGEYVVASAGHIHAISENGLEMFFTHCGVSYVHLGSSTFMVSSSGEVLGASADGSKAFFTNGSGELFMDMIDSETGHEGISETVLVTPGASASVVVSSDDGSHVYFTSGAVLAGTNTQGDSPQSGANNLYVYDSLTHKTVFIAIATVEINSSNKYEAQTTPDGSFLVFVTSSQLTADDKNMVADVYRYDAETGGLVRVSVGENGYDENGEHSKFPAMIAAPRVQPQGGPDSEEGALASWRLGTRAVSDDGSTVVFSSAEPLSSRAVNSRALPGIVNVYVWREGRVGMISTGQSESIDEYPVVSSSGQDIFFVTSQDILPQDSDGLPDVYDARVGGGFPEASVVAGGCSGDTCQGPPSVPSLLAPPASATFAGLGNPSAPGVSKGTVKAMPKGKGKGKSGSKCRSGYVRKRGKCVKLKRARKAGRVPGHGHVGRVGSGEGRS